ncbi:SRPBCC family protein [Sphingobacterium sp. LRF_L2]|uniref:SRPBCC family protein n=1 Tax=Sphingobacterium sp. LRF_L2 TaxID=3369421 RepID=UPI003F611A34
MIEPAPILVERTYSASPQSIWEALTEKDKLAIWYFEIPNFELQKGAEFDFYESKGGNNFHYRIKILEFKPRELLRYSWSHPSESKGSSIVTWYLTPRGNATAVRIVHEGIENFSDAGEFFGRARFEKGWDIILGSSLAHFLEDNN